jgi:hypothetical protein
VVIIRPRYKVKKRDLPLGSQWQISSFYFCNEAWWWPSTWSKHVAYLIFNIIFKLESYEDGIWPCLLLHNVLYKARPDIGLALLLWQRTYLGTRTGWWPRRWTQDRPKRTPQGYSCQIGCLVRPRRRLDIKTGRLTDSYTVTWTFPLFKLLKIKELKQNLKNIYP